MGDGLILSIDRIAGRPLVAIGRAIQVRDRRPPIMHLNNTISLIDRRQEGRLLDELALSRLEAAAFRAIELGQQVGLGMQIADARIVRLLVAGSRLVVQ